MLGNTSIQKLDAIVDRQIDVMKIDVKGFEYDVSRGGMDFSSKNPVGFIVMEFNEALLRANNVDSSEMFGQLENWGYDFSTRSFRGPWISLEEIKLFEISSSIF
jgi:hypothetical protein